MQRRIKQTKERELCSHTENINYQIIDDNWSTMAHLSPASAWETHYTNCTGHAI